MVAFHWAEQEEQAVAREAAQTGNTRAESDADTTGLGPGQVNAEHHHCDARRSSQARSILEESPRHKQRSACQHIAGRRAEQNRTEQSQARLQREATCRNLAKCWQAREGTTSSIWRKDDGSAQVSVKGIDTFSRDRKMNDKHTLV